MKVHQLLDENATHLTPEYLLKHFPDFIKKYAKDNNLSDEDAAIEISAIRNGTHDVSSANLKAALSISAATTHIGRLGRGK